MFFRLVTSVGQKKKFWVPLRNRASDLRIPRSDALPLSHRDSTVSEVYYVVHMTHVLHTARISTIVFSRFDSSWALRIFLSHAREETKKHLFLFLYRAQKLTISLISIKLRLMVRYSTFSGIFSLQYLIPFVFPKRSSNEDAIVCLGRKVIVAGFSSFITLNDVDRA